MAAPNSGLDVCNASLDLLSEEPIANITNPTDRLGKRVARWYDARRRAVLRRHTWNFATKRVSLPALAAEPEYEYSTAYQLPSDFIRFVDAADLGLVDYAIEDGTLLCNESGTLNFRYIYDCTNISKWDAQAVEVLKLDLAMYLAPGCGKKDMIGDFKELLDEASADAHATDGQESPPKRIHRSRLRSARRGIKTRRGDIYE